MFEFEINQQDLFGAQVAEVAAFCRALADHCRRRPQGVDSRGNRHGSDNAKLSKYGTDLGTVGDLLQLQTARFAYVTVDIAKASERLHRSGLVPVPCSVESIRAVFDELHSDRCSSMATYQQLLKHLLAVQTAQMKPYLDLVVRIWLLSPPESVVESMGNVVIEVFGTHRQLSHANTASL